MTVTTPQPYITGKLLIRKPDQFHDCDNTQPYITGKLLIRKPVP